ncbi:L-threonine kinase [Clostridium algifaecis]|uniref:L-threonine kinase n=1 Tax=Clostridium algifaecis TaxID=1472040 RepID=A0ABS4KT45_9CLOT|nr:kinase [Clostridium algifaecis]MBP2032556.1 L-threonine kinase [Clostridium algifaecis]
MEFTTFYPGSFGEVIQGRVKNKELLASFPVNIYTEVKLFECIWNEEHKKSSSLKKAYKFMYNLLKHWGYGEYYSNLFIDVRSQIPVGKGMASSTADLCALYYCLLKMFKRKFDEKELLKCCISVEPTDSILFSKMTLFDYKNGEYIECLGEYMDFNILAFEGNRVIDTVKFNKENQKQPGQVDDLIPDLKQAIVKKDLAELAGVSTESILRNQNRLYYSFFKSIIEICRTTGGLGIIGAHSGDVLGIIYDDREKLNFAERKTHIDKLKIYKVNALSKIECDNEIF